jgi:hypothetical protein
MASVFVGNIALLLVTNFAYIFWSCNIQDAVEECHGGEHSHDEHGHDHHVHGQEPAVKGTQNKIMQGCCISVVFRICVNCLGNRLACDIRDVS